jgi:hypothetical protein
MLIKIGMAAQRQRAVGWSDWLGVLFTVDYGISFKLDQPIGIDKP